MNKKIIIAIVILIILVSAVYAAIKLFEGNGAGKGQTIGSGNMPHKCAKGLKPMAGHPGGYRGDCSAFPAPGGLAICSNCGNGICDIENGENKCNCPEDCK